MNWEEIKVYNELLTVARSSSLSCGTKVMYLIPELIDTALNGLHWPEHRQDNFKSHDSGAKSSPD